MICDGSNRHVGLSAGQMRHTGGAVRFNKAVDVRCPVCARRFDSARITYTDHGIPTPPRALVPRHNKEES